MAEDKTTIDVFLETYRRLNARKDPGDSFDDVVRRTLDQVEELEAELRERDERIEELEDLVDDVDGPPPAEPLEADQGAPLDPGGAASVGASIRELDVPGSGDVRDRRRELVEAVVDRIRDEGSASRSELLENVVDDHADAAGYASPVSAWKNLVRPSLHDLTETIDELESPGEGGHRWRWLDRDRA